MAIIQGYKGFKRFELFDNPYNLHPVDIKSGIESVVEEIIDYAFYLNLDTYIKIITEIKEVESIFIITRVQTKYILYFNNTEVESISWNSSEVDNYPPSDPLVFIYYASGLVNNYKRSLDSLERV